MSLLLAISVLPLLIMFVCSYPMLVLWAFPVLKLVDAFAEYALTVGGVDVLPIDPAIFFAMAYLVVSVLRYPRKVVGVLKENIFLTIFLAVVVLYVVIYTPIYGQSAVGEARKLYGFFVFPLFALLVIKKPEDLRRFVQVTILVAALVAVAALGLAAIHGSIVKVIGAEGSLIIAFAAFAMLIHRFHGVVVFDPVIDRVLLFLFAALAIGLGHRSVWLAIGFGLMLVFWLYFARPVFVIKCAVILLMLLMAGGSVLVYFPEVGARLSEAFAGITNPYTDTTASWRIEGWQFQLEELQDSGRLLFGEGMGGYYKWYTGTGVVTVSPHNGYIQMVLKLGLFGLGIYGLLTFAFFRRAAIYRKRLPRGPMKAYLDMGILNFGAGHAYMLGYNIVPVIWFFFAVALCAINLCRNPREIPHRPLTYTRKLARIPWLPSMTAPLAPLTRYER